MLYVLQTASPLVWAWMSDMLPRDPEQRSMIIGVCIAFYYATSKLHRSYPRPTLPGDKCGISLTIPDAWANPLIYPASEAPHYKRGWFAVLALLIFSTLTIISLRIYDVKVARYVLSLESTCRLPDPLCPVIDIPGPETTRWRSRPRRRNVRLSRRMPHRWSQRRMGRTPRMARRPSWYRG
jgi:hypothetical protein